MRGRGRPGSSRGTSAGSSRITWRSASDPAATRPTTARFAGTRRCCGSAPRGSPGWCRCSRSTHNLHAYDELHLEWSRFAMPAAADTRDVLGELYPALHGWLRSGERVLLHQEELGDCVMGVVAGYLLWSEILPDGPRAITAMEQLLRRQMGTVGRMIVSVVEEVPSLESFALSCRPSARRARSTREQGTDPGGIVRNQQPEGRSGSAEADAIVGPRPHREGHPDEAEEQRWSQHRRARRPATPEERKRRRHGEPRNGRGRAHQGGPGRGPGRHLVDDATGSSCEGSGCSGATAPSTASRTRRSPSRSISRSRPTWPRRPR